MNQRKSQLRHRKSQRANSHQDESVGNKRKSQKYPRGISASTEKQKSLQLPTNLGNNPLQEDNTIQVESNCTSNSTGENRQLLFWGTTHWRRKQHTSRFCNNHSTWGKKHLKDHISRFCNKPLYWGSRTIRKSIQSLDDRVVNQPYWGLKIQQAMLPQQPFCRQCWREMDENTGISTRSTTE